MLRKLRTFKSLLALSLILAPLSVTATAQQDMTFITPDGQSVSLSSLRGKVVILVFGGVQDPQCRDEFKALESLSERYKGKDVGIYWVSVNSVSDVPNDKLRNPCGPVGSVVVLRDQAQAGFKRYGGRQLPTVVVLNPQGEVYGQPRGGFNPNSDFVNDLAAIIDGMLNKK
jgi:thiol-disulfide isomerase/thioredoxin